MTTPLADVFAGSSAASSVSQALGLNKPTVAVPNNSSSSDRFWATPAQPASSPTQEVLEINLSTASLVNVINFEVAKFPHTIRIEYTADSGNVWLPVRDAYTGQNIDLELLRSYPVVLPPATSVVGHSHPQHDYDGHWETISLNVIPANMQKVRFILQRTTLGSPPVDTANNAVPYSLALQDINIGYEVSTEDDIPRGLLDSQNTEGVFANSSDIFGSNLGFSKKTNFANNLLFNTDASAPLIWKSEPQPFPGAVVNFYADLRDRTGNAQVIDRIFIDPLYDGSHITLYYSNDSVTADFVSSRAGLNGNQASLNNATVSGSALGLGGYGDTSFVQVSNQYLSFDPSQPWWVGLEFVLGFAQSADSNDHALFSNSAFEVGFNSTGIYLSTSSNDRNTVPVALDSVNPVQLVASYDGTTLHLAVQQAGVVTTGDLLASVAIGSTLPVQLYVGTDVTLSKFANSPVTALILSQSLETGDGFLLDPDSYSNVSTFVSQSAPAYKNALLRFDPSQVTATSPTGLIGGPAFNYETMSWTPITREYEMHRGSMELPATKAKFWNLEITNLRPEVSEKFIPVTRNVKTFPPLVTTSAPTAIGDRQSPDDLATNVQSSLSNVNSFMDIPTYVGTGGTPSGITNTEVYISDDYATAQNLATLGSQWKYTQMRPDRDAPRFNVTGPHVYNVDAIRQTSNISYFTGLRQIQFSRTVLTSAQDFSFIEETFVDGTGINDGTWQVVPSGGLYSGSGTSSVYARTTSVIIPTQRAIRGLQYATQQTDNKQINTNGEFSDPNYDPSLIPLWSPTGDGKILGLTQSSSGGDVALLVSRQTQTGFWGDISVNYQTWGGLKLGKGYQSATDNVTFPTNTSTQPLSQMGIQQSTIQVFSNDGTITYALGTDYTLTASDGSNPDTTTTITIVSSGTIPTATAVTVTYNYSDAAHPTTVAYSDLKSGNTAPTFFGGMQSQPIRMPSGGRIHAAARVTATETLTQPLWIQIIDSDTGGLLSEQQSNVAQNEVKEWYASIDVKDLSPKVGLTWGDMSGKKIWPSFNDTWAAKANSSTLGQMVSGQYWATGSTGTPLTIASGAAKVAVAGASSQIDLRTPWGILDVTLGTFVNTSTAPLIDLGGMILQTNGTVTETDESATKFTFSTVPATGVRYRFKFMPTNAVPVGQQVSGADPIARPYSLLVFTRNNDTPTATETWVQTYSGTRSFGTVRALTGLANQTYTYFNWIPSTVQVNVTNQLLTVNYPPTASLVDTGDAVNYVWDEATGRHWIYTGVYTFAGNLFTSLAPGVFTTPGTMAVTDVKDQYGSLDFNVTQVSSGLGLGAQPVAYLNYNPASGKVITLQADGTIYDQINAVTLKTTMFSSAVNGPISVRYVSAQTLSSGFKTTWSVTGTQAMVFLQSNAVVGVYSGTGIWDTTVRGIAGASSGITSGTYTKIEGFSWNPDASLLALNTATVTWANVTYSDTRTYGQMSLTTPPTTQNIIIRLIQKTPSLDYWFAQSVALFWDPIVWAFSADGGLSFWGANDIKNNPDGVLLFPYRLTNYSNLQWRVTSYSSDVHISNLTIRPWYQGLHQGIPPRPTQLPAGPNLVPSDHFGPIDQDPKWMVWDKPIPRWWWFNFKKTQQAS